MSKKSKLQERTGTSYAAEKAAIYTKLEELLGCEDGQAREAFDLVVEEVMASAIRVGSFRFNGGHGVLHLHTYTPFAKTLPDHSVRQVQPEPKLRLHSGRMTRALLENKGNLHLAQFSRLKISD